MFKNLQNLCISYKSCNLEFQVSSYFVIYFVLLYIFVEMIVILKQGDNEWIKLNVLLDIRPDKFQFTLPISNVTKR